MKKMYRIMSCKIQKTIINFKTKLIHLFKIRKINYQNTDVSLTPITTIYQELIAQNKLLHENASFEIANIKRGK